MKVIHLISGGDSGGAKTHVLSLLDNLGKVIDVQLVCFMEGPFADEARAIGIPTKVFPGRNPLRICRALEKYIRDGGYEIIHCHGSRANMFGAMLQKRMGIPVCSTVHSDYKLDYMGRPLGALVYGNVNAHSLKKIKNHIGVSESMVRLLILRGFKPDSFFTIYNGIDFTRSPFEGEDRLPYLRSLGVDADENSVVVGIAARLNPVKDMSTLVRGFAEAYKKCDRLRLVIAGDGEEMELLKNLAKELGVENRVFLPGWISGGMDRFYNAIDINALTSLSETFPYALTEGARFSLPTVATAVGGIPDLIDDGVNGYLFEPRDWRTLGDRLARLALDDALRESMGREMFKKASEKFSIQATIDTQLDIYSRIKRRAARIAPKRDGVVICGAYGRGNSGDDAILEAITCELRSIDPDMPIHVLSRDPMQTKLQCRCGAVYTFNILRWIMLMCKSRLYINGGGSLIQDITSSRSLYFYLFTISMAKILGNRVQMYGCGIGPIITDKHLACAGRILNRRVDVITLREPNSMSELERMKVNNPRVIIAADPTLTLEPAGENTVNSMLLASGVPIGGKYAAFVLRRWPGFEEKTGEIAKAADYIYEKYGCTPVFLPIERPMDVEAAKIVAAKMTKPYYLMENAGAGRSVIGVLSRMQVAVSMRLHGLVFAAAQGVPLVGIVYDPKVSSFLSYMGQDRFTDINDVTFERLKEHIDSAMAESGDSAARQAAVERLRGIEVSNRLCAESLLSK
ncbi:MAG: polysaccharide pyruvyl transferase CsaB [Oscillospiraceae bacterium]|nr:polysaccharide pyruvyl transferase CsaB [Oscillospiraceae bacterium]